MIIVDICVSDIPKEKITTSEKNGKKYLKIVVAEKREIGKYGDTHSVYINPTKEEREAKADKIYIGSGKELNFDKKAETAELKPLDGSDDIPF